MDSLILGLRVLVALGAVLGLMWFLQRRLGKGTGRRRADHTLTVVSRQSVGAKASVVVVDAVGQRFLLGVTEHAVNVLHSGDIPAQTEDLVVPEPPRSLTEFARILAETSPLSLGQHGPRKVTSNEAGAGSGKDSGSGSGDVLQGPPLPRRSSIHRSTVARSRGGHDAAGTDADQPLMHGSILSGSTWEQAAAALRSGRRR